jgi:DNA polymerase, archaea type
MSVRRYAITTGTQVSVPLDKLPLDGQPSIPVPQWQPTREIAPYESLTKGVIDIETTGLDPETDRVIMIGLLVVNPQGAEPIIISHPDEGTLLKQFWQGIKKVTPQVLIGHNLFAFDLPFLARRSELLGITHPLVRGDREKRITASSLHGKPITFTPWTWRGIDIVDTLHQVAIWDKSASKLTGYGLKDSVITLGLRSDRRLELDHQQIKSAWAEGDLKTIGDYLRFDLEDTQLLADFLLPVVWYQQRFVPGLRFQDLAVASPALKAQKIHQRLGLPFAEADDPLKFDGGVVECVNPGLHHPVAKIDVSSLYPSIMLRYGICSRKDPEHKFLGVLQFMTQERLRLKELAKGGDKSANHQQNALKILINGSYGYLGTSGYSYNDYEAAALVTAYGRKIMELMQSVVESMGATVIELDTDGIMFTSDRPEDITQAVQDALPVGINVELEFSGCGAYVPKSKSYVIVSPGGKVTVKGLFRKRGNYPLENRFPVEFIRRWFTQSPDVAQEYCHTVRESITTGTIDIEDLTVARRIAKSEKTLVNRGLGQPGDRVRYWFGVELQPRKRKSPKEVAVAITSGDYWAEHYLNKLDVQYGAITGIMPKNTAQLPLFAVDQPIVREC